jgi:Fic-DOC domain mobile mystery protein B
MMELEAPAPGNTPLNPEEIQGLRIPHIQQIGELNRWEQSNIQEAMDWLEKRRKTEVLDVGFMCLLHKKMFGKVWKWAGSFRKSEKNLGIPWFQIPTSIHQLAINTQYWIDQKSFSEEEIAVRFHHQLVLIHPFSNGNGRHARIMADLILTEKLGKEPFSWGSGNLIDAGNLRKNYINALKAADQHDYRDLIQFVRS